MPTPPVPDPHAKDATPSTRFETQPSSSLPTTPQSGPAGGAALSLQPGARPLPEYELVRKLGAGGFGEVWHARGPGGLDVALKFIRLAGSGSALEMRALEMMKSIRHPNLVSLFGVWRKDDLLILAMELCDCTLHDRLKETVLQNNSGIPVKELLNYMRDAASGLDTLNEKQVQHRDVKPMNLLMLGRGVKVADFGLAKWLEGSVASNTGAMTPAYAAPEFMRGEISQHSDQYSLAATYYELRTGRLLFGGNIHQMMYGHLEQTPDLSRLEPDERAVVARALAKDPSKRWKNCKSFVNALIVSQQKSKVNPEAKAAAKPAPVPTAAMDNERTEPQLPVAQLGKVAPKARPKSKAVPTAQFDETTIQEPAEGRSMWFWLAVVAVLVVLPVCSLCLIGGNHYFQFIQYPWNTPHKPDDEHASLPPTMTIDLGDDVRMAFVLIDPAKNPDKGLFLMGSPPDEEKRNPFDFNFDTEKQRQVTLTKPYYLGKYPVTQGEYARLMSHNPSNFCAVGGGADQVQGLNTNWFPVENMSWEDAQEFCREMEEHADQTPGALRDRNYRFALPTEAQWEYACRAGTTTPFHFGTALNGKQANCNGGFPYGTKEAGPYLARPRHVGSYDANAWGLYDMHGNVWQWCQDFHGPYDSLPATDPVRNVMHEQERHVLRGGCWISDSGYCRSACRYTEVPSARNSGLGFRVAFRAD
jgi:formylglycine-generating enzyme required for sulfatase activity